MSTLSQFFSPSSGSNKPLRVVKYTSGTGTFVPLSNNSWCRAILVGGGGNGLLNWSYHSGGAFTDQTVWDGGNGQIIDTGFFQAPLAGLQYAVGAAGVNSDLRYDTMLQGYATYIPGSSGGNTTLTVSGTTFTAVAGIGSAYKSSRTGSVSTAISESENVMYRVNYIDKIRLSSTEYVQNYGKGGIGNSTAPTGGLIVIEEYGV